MSQVIVEEDGLAEKRQRSKQQERKIDTVSAFTKWQKGGEQGQAFIARAAGVAMLPVAAFWGLLYFVGTFVITVFARIFDFLGSLKDKR